MFYTHKAPFDWMTFLLIINFWLIYWAEWVTDPFEPEFYSAIQNNFCPNFRLKNIVVCEPLMDLRERKGQPSPSPLF